MHQQRSLRDEATSGSENEADAECTIQRRVLRYGATRVFENAADAVRMLQKKSVKR